MIIVYRGNFQPDTPAEARWSTESQVAATLEMMGHRVIRAQENDPEWCWDRVVAACQLDVADLFLWTQTWNLDPGGGYRALDELRAAGVPSVSFHLDLWWGLARAVQLLEFPFFRTDYVFTADGGHDADFARNGINHRWSPPAIYEAEIRAGTPSTNYSPWPVVFVGSYPYPHPEHAEARRDVVTFLQSSFARQFRHYRGGVRGGALADLYASAPVVVGDSCMAGRFSRYWSDRIPETLGRAGFLIHPYIDGIEGHYRDGEHLRLYQPGDLGQLGALVRHYLAHPDEARRIARAGQEHVKAHHTYRHRLAAVLDQVAATAEVGA